jgi:hypothetical protein
MAEQYQTAPHIHGSNKKRGQPLSSHADRNAGLGRNTVTRELQQQHTQYKAEAGKEGDSARQQHRQ